MVGGSLLEEGKEMRCQDGVSNVAEERVSRVLTVWNLLCSLDSHMTINTIISELIAHHSSRTIVDEYIQAIRLIPDLL